MATNYTEEQQPRLFNVLITDINFYQHDTYNYNGTERKLNNHPENIEKLKKWVADKYGKPVEEVQVSIPKYLILTCKVEENGEEFDSAPVEVKISTDRPDNFKSDWRLILEALDHDINKLRRSKTINYDELTINKVMNDVPLGGSKEKGYWINFKEWREMNGYVSKSGNDGDNNNQASTPAQPAQKLPF